MRFLATIMVLGLGLLPTAAHSTDGDVFGDSTIIISRNFEVYPMYLCDGDKSGASDCTEVDLAAGVGTSALGIPDYIVVSIETEADCSASPTVTPNGADTSAGTTHDLTTIALTSAGASQAVISPVPNRYLNVALAQMTACTDFEVVLKRAYEREASN